MATEKLITLEEAAKRLDISPAAFRQKLQTDTAFKTLSKIRDGSTFRFKPTDIEELRRNLGFGSDEEFQLADPSSDEKSVPLELKPLDDDSPKPGKSSSSKPASGKSKAAPAKPSIDDDDAVIDITEEELNLGGENIFELADDELVPKSKKSSGKLKPAGKPDSDVKLAQSGKVKRAAIEEPSDEVELDILPNAGSSSRLSSPGKPPVSSSKLSGKSGPSKTSKTPAAGNEGSSEFELNLDPDSSDEFELSLAKDSSDEISLGELPPPSSGDSKAGLASGINIGKPKDRGLSLEKKGTGRSSKKIPAVKPEALGDAGRNSKKMPAVKPPAESDDEIEFELSLDEPGTSSKNLGSSKKLGSSKNLDDDSEFDLTLDEPSDTESSTTSMPVDEEKKNDIFETDFEIPALDDDSASEAVALDEADTDLESSDFDLAIDESGEASEEESGSQVIVLDDETDDHPEVKKKPRKKKPKAVDAESGEDDSDSVGFDDMDLDESSSASRALKGVRESDADDAQVEERVVVITGAPWGVLPAIVLLPTVFMVFVCGLMAYEMMHSMWGYHQPTKPSSMVIDFAAEMFDMKPKE